MQPSFPIVMERYLSYILICLFISLIVMAIVSAFMCKDTEEDTEIIEDI